MWRWPCQPDRSGPARGGLMMDLPDHIEAADVVAQLAAVVSTLAGTDRTGYALRALLV